MDLKVMENILHDRKQILLAKRKIQVSVFLKVIDSKGWHDQIHILQRKLLLYSEQVEARHEDVGSSVVCNMSAGENKSANMVVVGSGGGGTEGPEFEWVWKWEVERRK